MKKVLLLVALLVSTLTFANNIPEMELNAEIANARIQAEANALVYSSYFYGGCSWTEWKLQRTEPGYVLIINIVSWDEGGNATWTTWKEGVPSTTAISSTLAQSLCTKTYLA